MSKSSKDPPQTPTRIPRPFTPTNGTSPTRSNPRRGMGLLQAVGRGDIFRGASRAEGVGRIGVWPLSTTVNEAQGNAVGPMRPAAHQSSIPPPINTTYQQNPSRPASSRGPSASIMTGSPDSQLTTGYTSATTSTSPEGVTGDRRRVMSGNTMVAVESSGYHPYAPQVRHRRPGSSLPVRSPPPRPPPEPCDIAYFMPGAWTKRELKLPKSPKVPSAASDDSLGSKHRDSLRLASIQNIPRLTPPGTKKGKFSDFFTNENADSPQSDGSQAKPGQGSGAGSQMSRESSVFEEWPLPVEKLKDSSELELQDARTKESPGAAENEGAEQKDIIESKDDEHMEGFTQKEVVEQMDADQKESDDLSPGSKKADAELERDHREEPLIMDVSCMLASMGLEEMNDYDPSKHILPGESAPRGTRRQDLLDLSPATDLNSPQSQLGSGSAHKTFDLRSQLPRPTQKAGGEKESGIPKSRTRNVLNNLTSSLSRASLSSFRINSRRHTPSAMTSPNEDDSPARTQRPSDEDLISAQQASAAHHLDSVRLIYEARDAEWWTGRFLALEDRFRNENLSPENMAAIIAAATKIPGPTTTTASKPQNPAGLPSSSTMACFPSSSNAGAAAADDDDDAQKKKAEAKQRAALLTDEDARARRVFAHLHALCMTEAARKSLRAFQQQYARNAGKEALLPPGGTMYEDPKGKGKRWVGRIFSGKDKDKEDGGKKGGGGPSR